jgi:superoxide dismutase, Cu-Zn family
VKPSSFSLTLCTTLAIAGCARDTRPATTAAAPAASVPVQPSAPAPLGHTPMGLHDATTFVDPGAEQPQPVTEAIAVLFPTQGHQVSGTVRFRSNGREGLEVISTVEGLTGPLHAYHVHVYGDCSAPDATSAGPHFHFVGSSLDESVPVITGNLGELRGTATGPATHQLRLPLATLHGRYSLLGRSVVVHAGGNDPDVTPDGGAGARIACGVIGVANPEPTSPDATARTTAPTHAH